MAVNRTRRARAGGFAVSAEDGARDSGDSPSDEPLTDEDRAHFKRVADSDVPFAEDAKRILENL
jgi:hypothetical protein